MLATGSLSGMSGVVRSVIIVGAGGHGRSLADVVESTAEFGVAGFLDNFVAKEQVINGHEILGTFSDIPAFADSGYEFLVGIGQINSPSKRLELFAAIDNAGGHLPVVVSPHAYVSPRATLGRGTVVFHGAVVNAGATIGENCIINSLALVEHDTVIGDSCHVSTGARVNGGVTVGEGSFIGSGAVIFHNQQVPEASVVSAGTTYQEN